jgi:HEAT repeat protein
VERRRRHGADHHLRVDREELYVRVRWPFRSAERWYEEYRRAWHDLEHGPVAGVERAYDRRVAAVWGLIARAGDALPFALEMLRSRNPEIRADATSVLERLQRNREAIPELIRVVETETELEPLDAAVGALERLRAREALPALTHLLRDESRDGDTRFGAAHTVGKIVGARLRRGHEIEDALAALDRDAEGRG